VSERSQTPAVTAIVITLNGLPHLEPCLESVQECEVIVVDHGSVDGTQEEIRTRYPAVRLIEQANLGFAAGVNAGVRAASGQYILLLNPDAWLVGDGLQTLVDELETDASIGVVGPRLRNLDGSVQPSIRGFPTLWRLVTQYTLLNRLAPHSRLLNDFYDGGRDLDRTQDVEFLRGACLLVRREALEDVGPFDETFFMFAEEADWCLRARQRGWRTVYVPRAEAVHVGETTTRSVWSYERAFREQERSHLRFVAKHGTIRRAELARLVILVGYLLRSFVGPPDRRPAYRRVAVWLARTTARTAIAETGRSQ
jgi:GT2 family glycosyltransferase